MSEVATDLLLYMSAQNELAGYAAENLKAINSCGSLDNISAYIMLDKFKDDQSRVTEDYAVPVGAVLNIQNPFVWPDKETSSPDVFKRFLIRARTHFGDTAKYWCFGGMAAACKCLMNRPKARSLQGRVSPNLQPPWKSKPNQAAII